MKQYFVTGTDTEVGKTYVTCHLLRAATQAKLTTIGYKPIAAGCDLVDGEWVNEDAANIQQASGLSLAISEINPIALKPPIAPHIAASEAGVELTQDAIEKGLNHLQSYNVDFLLMEGAGGWRLPLSLGNDNAPTRYLSDVVKSLNMLVILVVGMRLGCLNHAMLTAEAIIADDLTIAGWVANDVTGNMTRYDENLASLKAMMPAPLLAEIPFKTQPSDAVLQCAIEQLV
ncbi:dethiobiotin synthase [Alteromonas gracilis]|uniref:dethiobiotin synthase n=1 Tax=Alteromonas gracilis TaxID=1479524 RepID=UPI00321A6603